jgi:hypothetical protein
LELTALRDGRHKAIAFQQVAKRLGRKENRKGAKSPQIMALSAPADVPYRPSMMSRPSSRRWSITPQVKAP